jgi:hypothetical protein
VLNHGPGTPGESERGFKCEPLVPTLLGASERGVAVRAERNIVRADDGS